MNLVVSGTITRIFDGEIRGTTFESRKFWVKEVDVQYPNCWPLEMHQGNCNLLDKFAEGELVTCNIDLRGRHWSNAEKEGCMTSLVCWKITPGLPVAAAPQAKPQQKPAPQQHYAHQAPSASDVAADDLPF